MRAASSRFALGEFGRFRDGRQTRKCLSLMGCLLMAEGCQDVVGDYGTRWMEMDQRIRHPCIRFQLFFVLFTHAHTHPHTCPLFNFSFADGNQSCHHLPLGPGCPGCPGSPGKPGSPGSPRKPGVPTQPMPGSPALPGRPLTPGNPGKPFSPSVPNPASPCR